MHRGLGVLLAFVLYTIVFHMPKIMFIYYKKVRNFHWEAPRGVVIVGRVIYVFGLVGSIGSYFLPGLIDIYSSIGFFLVSGYPGGIAYLAGSDYRDYKKNSTP